ncbi:MAG: HAMP domain-containing histidine kinase [Spirochaetaceae bacterium]|nr:HAMP domain-containing histidine kinase [Spirochaetaceae bacterium]
MKKGFKIQTVGSLWPAVLIVILILVFSAALLREGRLRDVDIARLGSLEAATSITEDIEEDLPVGRLTEAVTGWGIYSPEGTSIASWGTAPEYLMVVPSDKGLSEEMENNRLRTIRTLAFAGQSRGRGYGMHRLVLIDWDLRISGKAGLWRIIGAAGLTILAVSLLIMQQLSARRMIKQRKLVQLGLAARTLTHEIRNPLGVLKAQQALLKKILPPEQAVNLSIIGEEINRLTTLTDKVREWLADPAGKPAGFDISAELSNILERQPWEVRNHFPQPGPRIMMDPALFSSTLVNLIRNAVESQEGIPDIPPPEVTLNTHGKMIRIFIQDQGKGLPEGNPEDLFNPFFTTKIKGSGIGLALSRQFVEAAGGSLYIENRISNGSIDGVRVIIELPREKN